MASVPYLPEYYGGAVPGVKTPTQDPRYSADVYEGQRKLAKDFRANLPQYQNTLFNNAAKESRQNLAKSLVDTKKSYNSRGLLRSGMRQGAELGQRGQAAYDLNKRAMEINSGLSDTADMLEDAYTNTGLGTAGVSAGSGGLLTGYENSLNNYLNEQNLYQRLYGSIGGGIGSLLGSIRSGK